MRETHLQIEESGCDLSWYDSLRGSSRLDKQFAHDSIA